MVKKIEEIRGMSKIDLSSYIAGLELQKMKSSKELRKVTTKHSKLTNAINEAKAELMFRNSKIQAIRIPGFG